MSDPPIENYMTPAEAAKFLGISTARLRQLRAQGRVEGTRLGYNETVYTLTQLRRADTRKKKAGRRFQRDKHSSNGT